MSFFGDDSMWMDFDEDAQLFDGDAAFAALTESMTDEQVAALDADLAADPSLTIFDVRRDVLAELEQGAQEDLADLREHARMIALS